jgi:Zn-finger nucleic acid-binding protein
MAALSVRPRGAPQAVTVDRCERCGGLWLDRGEAEVVCPTVAYLERRHLEIVALGRQGGGIPRCPRCSEIPYEFRLLDLEVDYCPGCGGVWLEAHEQLGRVNLENVAGRPAPSPYRAVERAARTEVTTCCACGQNARVRETYMAAEGLVCRSCYHGAIERVQQRRAREAGTAATRPTTGSLLLELLGSSLD